MKKGFYSRRLIAALMAALLSINSLPVTVLAEETDPAGQSQAEAIMESDTEESDLTGESQEESVSEETIEDKAETVLQREEQSYELVDSGTCGENVTWTLDSEGLLTITGMGDMTNYTSSSECPWYSESASIVSIVVGDDVTNIGNYAFENLGNLTTATLGSSVTTIGESAFYSCSSLISINIPDNAKTIERGAFYGCRSLESIAIPDSVTTIGGSTFYGCTSLTSVNIPNGVTRIGWGMFYGCSGLTNIAIPKNVEYIENDAFSYCSNLSEINFECSVPVIWDESFYQVTATAYYPANDTSWTEDVRKNYGGTLTWKAYDRNVIDSGTCGENVTWTLDTDGVLVISGTGKMDNYNWTDGSPWYSRRTDVVSAIVEDGVTTIGERAFYECSELKNVQIADSVESIEFGAFSDCGNLTSIDMGSGVVSIAGRVFENCSSLVNIEIPDSVTDIRYEAFSGCSSLENVSIPDGVTSIEDYLFYGCSNLQAVHIPNKVTYIGNCVFENCSSLGSIELPESVANIGSFAFENCSSLKNIHIPESVTSINPATFQGCSNLESVNIPENVDIIDAYVFRNCSSLASIEIPVNVTIIGEGSFQNCSSLTSVDIPENVMRIENKAFGGCSNLNVIKFMGSAVQIKEDSFENVTATVAYPGNESSWKEEVRKDYGGTLTWESYIADFTVDSGSCGENVNWTLDKSGQLRISGTGEMTNYTNENENECPWYSYRGQIVSAVIEEGVTSIGNYAFYSLYNLPEINIPDSIVSIGTSALSACSELTSITIPDGVTTIGESAFSSCGNLTSIDIPNSVTSIERGAFAGCMSLTDISIPDSVTKLEEYVFSTCTSLTNIRIPDSVTDIGSYAFYDCRSLESIVIPSEVNTMGRSIFLGCSSLKDITFKGHAPTSAWFAFDGLTTTAYYPSDDSSWTEEVKNSFDGTITWKTYDEKIIDSGTCGEDVTWTLNSDGLLTISGTGKMADYTEAYQWPWYENREQIVSVVIEEGVTYIGYSAFEKFINLTSIEIPNSVTEIGWSAFADCSSLTEITIPSSVSYIGWGVFFGCTSLKEINVDEGNENYFSKDGVLFSGTTLTYCPGADRQEYVIPDGITSINESAFIDCSELTNIEMSSSVTCIGFAAFEGCSGLKKLELPTRVNEIQTRAFSGCSGLTEITFKGLAPTFGDSDVFGGVTADVYYPSNDSSWTEKVRQDYGGTLTWKSYTAEAIVDSGTCGEDVTWSMDRNGLLTISGNGKINDYSRENRAPWCAYRKNIVDVVIENGVTEIGSYTFAFLNNLINVEIPNSVTEIGGYAFNDCANLTEINIPNSVTEIGWYTFMDCSNLKAINIEEGNPNYNSIDGVLVNNEETTLIYYPEAHGEVYDIPDGVITIEDESFSGCTKLTNINISESVQHIGNYAFYGCGNLVEVNIPSGVTKIGESAFGDCTSLNAINVEEGNENYKSQDGVLFDHDMTTLYYCPGVNRNEYAIPYGVIKIDEFAFDNCSELTNIEIPNSVTGIGFRAFRGCNNLTTIKIPDSVNYIGQRAFENCSNLTEITFNGSAPEFGDDVFAGVTATAYYPSNDSSWTDEVRQNYGGTITWVEAGSEPEEKELTIIQQPESVTGKLGETAVFTVEAEGDGVTYQWQYCNNGSSTWKNSSMMGSTTNSIEVKITKGRIGQKYRCILQDNRDNKLVSEEAQIILAEEKELAITKQPESVAGKIGETAVFTVGAEGDGVTYQWQYCNSGSSAWKNSSMTGSTTNSIEVKITKGRIGQKYRCILKDSKGNKLTTEEAQIIQAEEKKLAVIQQPESVTGKIGETAVFTVEAEGEGVTYQWQYCNSGSSTWKNSSMTGSTTNSIEVKITKGRIGQKYRCILKDSKGNKLTTEEAQIKLAEEKELAIVKQPESVTGKVGETAIFTVEAEGEGVTYQWQYCNNGSTSWANSKMTGCDTNSIEVKITKGRIGQKYRCILKDSKGNKLITEEVQIIQEEK